MKKIVYLFLMSVLFLCQFSNLSYQKDCGYEKETSSIQISKSSFNNYMEAYYYNLNNNFGYNKNGSCGYVAVSILLSYYDNLLRDDIIDEQYDVCSTSSTIDFLSNVESPGTLHENDRLVNSYSSYYDYIKSTESTSFHSYLLSLGINLRINSKNSKYFETDINDRIKLIKSYLDSKNINYIIDTKTGKNVREYAIENVKKGYPVLLSIRKSHSGHAVIAYDYDEKEDKLYCHAGYYNKTHKTAEELGYTTYHNAMVFKINENHIHTNNYVLNGVGYCYCDLHLKVYCDVRHKFNYTMIDDANHYSICECGFKQIDRHQFSTSLSGGMTVYKCILCKATINGDKFHTISE